MSKILSIVGPTATGKTDFALKAAEKTLQLGKVSSVDIISADSRQVYQGLEIMSGADIPEGFQRKVLSEWSELNTYFEKGSIRLFGISLLQPDTDWSVGQFQEYVQRVLSLDENQPRLVILVGGTGLYHQQVFTSDPQLQIPPNLEVRQKAEKMSVNDLQQWLRKVNYDHFSRMNHSDQHNPRRLVRAIEISMAPKSKLTQREVLPTVFTIGLTDTIEHISDRISLRVNQRMGDGALAEVEKLLSSYPNQKLPAFTTTGVKPLALLTSGQISQEEAIELWTRQERQYAKRQLTWWKKRTGIKWFAIDQPNWQSRALEEIEAWWNA